MLRRLHARSEWENLYFCGDSTVMATGAPAMPRQTTGDAGARWAMSQTRGVGVAVGHAVAAAVSGAEGDAEAATVGCFFRSAA